METTRIYEATNRSNRYTWSVRQWPYRSRIVRETIKMKYYYLMLLPIFIYFLLFHYKPMYGVIIAFKEYRYLDGIMGSPWVGLKHFSRIFSDPMFSRIFKNTLIISSLRILFEFPAPIIFALLLNEVYHVAFKRVTQTISYLPHFMSWVVLGGIIVELLSPSRGPINHLLGLFGIKPIYFLAETAYIRSIIVITGIWQSLGWGSIIYLSAIANINVELYESAFIDGAGRLKQALYITLPSISPVIVILFILGFSRILNAGFDQVFNLYNNAVMSKVDIIDTYIYRVGLAAGGNFGYTTAIGLFKNVIGLILVLACNRVVKTFSDYTLF